MARLRLQGGRSVADILDPRARSARMAAVKQKHTGPELNLRKALHAAGYRYRLHPKHLPGRPDIVFPGRELAVFVHGCFWHGHDCRAGRRPATNQDYWLAKIEANQLRDVRKAIELESLGWTVITVWECELRKCDIPAALAQRLEERSR